MKIYIVYSVYGDGDGEPSYYPEGSCKTEYIAKKVIERIFKTDPPKLYKMASLSSKMNKENNYTTLTDDLHDAQDQECEYLHFGGFLIHETVLIDEESLTPL